jgi:8-oxo-dGTP diphosphatase
LGPRRFCYDHPHPAVTTDIAIFARRARELLILLIRRKGEPFAGCWALPGGFLEPDEDLDACAARELAEETGIEAVPLTAFATFSAPHRDPRERVISAAYFAVVEADTLEAMAGDDAAEVRWFPLSDLPPLAFDHALIIERAAAAVGNRTASDPGKRSLAGC